MTTTDLKPLSLLSTTAGGGGKLVRVVRTPTRSLRVVHYRVIC